MHSATNLGDSGGSAGEISSTTSFGRGWFLNEGVQTPRVGRLGTPRFSSTRVQVPPCGLQPQQTTPHTDLSSLISELADQIGQSIAAQLRSDKSTTEPVLTENSRPEQSHSGLNLSGVRLVMQSDVKEPPVFRGDSSDKCSVREWVDLMNVFFVKRNIPTEQQSQEILSKLMGKAKDVVRVTLRNNLSLDHIQTPGLIFDILKQHYSELTYSSMPMADFYNTRPLQHEGVMEYWIRLNNAIDIADECLRRQGRSVEDPGREVTMMFIKYCPDPVLFNRLSFKAAEEWTTSEVQERIDSFLRELRTRSHAEQRAPHKHAVSHAQTTMLQGPEVSHVSPLLSTPHFTSPAPPTDSYITTPTSAPTFQLSPTADQFIPSSPPAVTPHAPQAPTSAFPTPVVASQYTQPAACPPVSQAAHHCPAPPITTAIDGNSMQALISLLDRMMARQEVQVATSAVSPQQYAPGPFQRKSCRVCGDTSHSTLMHCRKEKLCLSCYSPGHFKRDCNRHNQRQVGPNSPSQSQPQGN